MTPPAKLTASALTLVCALAVASCGVGDAGSEAGEPTQSSAPTSSESAPDGNPPTDDETDETEETEEEDDSGPSFFEKVFDVIPRDNPCRPDNTMVLDQSFDVVVDRLENASFCFADRGWEAPLVPSIQVTLPDGSRAPAVFAVRGQTGLWMWRFTPGGGEQPVNQVGTYGFVIAIPPATHPQPTVTLAPTGSTTAPTVSAATTGTATGSSYSGSVTVQDSVLPRIRYADMVQAGGTVTVALAGYEPGSTVQIVVYGPGLPRESAPRSYARVRSLPAATADEHGEAHTAWEVPSDAEAGLYGFWVDPLPQGCHQLCVQVTVS